MLFKKVAFCVCLLFLSSVFQTEVLAAPSVRIKTKVARSEKVKIRAAVSKKPKVKAVDSAKLRAKAAVLLDAENGKVLFAKNANKPLQPASLTKVLTLYLVHDAINKGEIDLSEKTKISMEAYLTGGSSMYLEEGDDVELADLVKGIAVVSANDASVAIAERLGGDVTQFVKMMNEKARELGMKHSRFVNPNGLPAKGQVSTALDVAKLARSYIRDFPESLSVHTMQSFTYRDITQRNHNDLLRRYPDADGLKTGFIRAAGFHLIATAKRGDTRLIAVVMGEKNRAIRAREASRLLDKGFKMTNARGKDPSHFPEARAEKLLSRYR